MSVNENQGLKLCLKGEIKIYFMYFLKVNKVIISVFPIFLSVFKLNYNLKQDRYHIIINCLNFFNKLIIFTYFTL